MARIKKLHQEKISSSFELVGTKMEFKKGLRTVLNKNKTGNQNKVDASILDLTTKIEKSSSNSLVIVERMQGM